MRRTLPALCLFSTLLSGCFDEPSVVLPPAPSPALMNGHYELHVVAVDSVSCPGVRARDLVGEELDVNLHAHGAKVRMDWEGLELRGEMRDGLLSASGGMAEEPPVVEAETESVDSGTVEPDQSDTGGTVDGDDCGGSSEDSGSSGSSAGSSGSSSGSSNGSSGSSHPSRGGGCVDDPPASIQMEVSVDLAIRSDRIADGTMEYQLIAGDESCSIQAEVSLVFMGRDGGKPTPVYDTEETEVADTGAVE